MKRFLSSILVLTLVFSLCVPTMAADTVEVFVETECTTAAPGEEVTFTVKVSNSGATGVVDACIKLDVPEDLEFKSADADPNGYFSTAAFESTTATFAAYSAPTAITGDWTAFTVTYTVKDDAAEGAKTVSVKSEDLSLTDSTHADIASVVSGATASFTVELPESPKVAKIEGGAEYETLKAAVDAAQDGDTVLLKEDIMLTQSIDINNKQITVDLGGKTVTAASAVFMVNDGADLTLTNGSVDASGDNGIVVWSVGDGTNANKITLDGVVLTAEDFVVYHNGNDYGAEVSIVDSELTSEVTAVYLSGLATDGRWPAGKGNKLVIENSEIEGSTAVETKRTEVTVKAGTVLTATVAEASMVPNKSGTVSTGYALALTSNAGKAVGSATVTGGTFNGKIGIEVNEGSANTATFAVSGGSFSEIVPVEYCAEGFVPVTEQDSDGKYTVEEEEQPVVAKIGEVEYTSLAEAVADAQDDDIIDVIENIALTETITINGGKTVNIAVADGKSITAATTIFSVEDASELNLTGGSYVVTGEYNMVVFSEGNRTAANKITLDSVTMNAEDRVVHHNGLRYGADITIVDSELESTDTVAIYLSGRATVDSSWPEGKNSTLTIKSSAVTGTSAVETKRTDVTIEAGTVLTATGEVSMVPNTSGSVSSGYALALTSNHGMAVGSATVTGGTFEGKIGIEVTEGVTNNAAFAVSGGSFSEIVPAEYCAEGFVPVTEQDSDGKYTVEQESIHAIAMIGDVPYASLAAAVAAAQDGDTVLLKEDIALTQPIDVNNKQITVDLGGKTVTASVAAFTVSGGADLSLTNGTVNATGENSIVVWSTGNGSEANKIDLYRVTLTADTFVVYHNGLKYGADVTIKSSTLVSNDAVAVYLAGRATVDNSWPEGKNSKLSIEASVIIGTSAVEAKRTDVIIGDGADLTATGAPELNGNKNGPASSGYALALTSNKGIAVGSATVTGGTFEGKIGIEVNEGVTNTATFAVSGGSFSEIVPEEYCAEGFIPVTEADENGKYTVTVEAPADESERAPRPERNEPTYSIKNKIDGIELSKSNAAKGDKVYIELDEEIAIEDVVILDKDGDEIEIEEDRKGYYFIMPAGKVTVELMEVEEEERVFIDVDEDEYFFEAVQWAVANNITSGTSAVTFSPEAVCTRAQVVTFLWRAAGCPAPLTAEMPFVDVETGAYYAAAVQWAVENNITAGTSATTFDPNGECTRGQIVTFLWRAQGNPAAAAVNNFVDVEDGAYYNAPVLWAVANGITNGTSTTTFSPAADCTRAQVVTFIYRCMAE